MQNYLGAQNVETSGTERTCLSLPVQWNQRKNGHQLCTTEMNLLRYHLSMQLMAIIFDNNDKAAYDHMIPSQCMILSAWAGVSPSAIQMKLTVLKRMKYFVKTAYGASQDYFQNTLLQGIYGMLQGSSEVCPIWSLSSLVQFDVLDKQIPMAVFPSHQPLLYTERNGEGFVDDVTLWETLLTSELREVQERMQAKAQAWERGVHVAGGALNLLKTIFFAVSWNFQKNGQPVMRTISEDPNIAINMTQGNNRTRTTPITRVVPTTGHRTLGVWLAPSGEDKTEYQYRLQEAIKLRPCLLRAPLNRESTQIGFTTMILQKFSYPLAATFHWEGVQQHPGNSPKWESTDRHQQKYDLDWHSMPACQFLNYGHSKVPPRTSSSLVIYERVITLAPTSK